MDLVDKNAIWFIETIPKDETIPGIVHGGGICFDPRGYILTVDHVLHVSVSDVGADDCEFHARPYNEESLFERDVKIVKRYPNLDLAVVRVSMKEDEESHNLAYVNIPPAVVVSHSEPLFSWVHQETLLFSFKSGYTCFGFPSDYVVPPDILLEATATTAVPGSPPTSLDIKSYRTLASVTDDERSTFLDLHPDLPLLQVTGFDGPGGISGCPVYRHATGELVGIFSISKAPFQYLIPVNFLTHVINAVRSDGTEEWDAIYQKELEEELDGEEDD